MSSRINAGKYKKAFRDADTDGSGKIGKEEMKAVLLQLGKQLVSVDKIFDKYDEDKSGQIDEAEFLLFMGEVDNAWIRVQAKTFTRWANTVLSNRMLKIESVTSDFRDGLKLAPLISILASKPLKAPNKKCRMKLQKMENLNKCLEFLRNDGIKLVNVGADDIEAGKVNLTLGLVWTLILKYQIGDSLEQGSPKWIILEWVKKQIEPYDLGVKLKNFKNGWSDGRVLSALTDSIGENKMNEIIDCTDIVSDPYEASHNALDTAEKVYEIPKILDAEDLVENPDEHSIMTYVSYFKDWAEKMKTRASAPNTTAEGPGVEGGDSRTKETDFKIICRNKQDKEVKSCDGGVGIFKATVLAPGEEEPSVIELKDNEDGTFSGSYPVEKPGDYKVDITLRGEPIKDSPFTPHFEAGSPSKSYCEGEGLEKGKTNRPCSFKIFAVDKDGNKVESGGDPFLVDVTGPDGKLKTQIEDNDDGTYDVLYSPSSAGDHTIAVSLFGEDVKDSPFTSTIKRAPNAGKSYVSGTGLTKAFDNKPSEFTVHAVDDVGNPVSGDVCDITIVPEDEKSDLAPIKPVVTDNGDGTYSVKYDAPTAGNYVITAKLDDEVVQGTPSTLRVSVGACSKNTGGASFKITIVAKGKDGKAKTEGGDDWVVTVSPPEEGEVDVKTSDNGDGTYSASYHLPASEDEPMEYSVSLQLNGGDVKGSPFKQYM